MSYLSMATMLVGGLIIAVSNMFLAIPFFSEDSSFLWGGALASIGVAGIGGSSVLIWSDQHGGRYGLLALVLAMVYCGLSVPFPYSLR